MNEDNIENMIALLHIHVVHLSRNKFSLLIFKIEKFTQIPPRIDINSKKRTILFSIFNPLVTCTNVNRWILAKTFIDRPLKVELIRKHVFGVSYRIDICCYILFAVSIIIGRESVFIWSEIISQV